MSTLIIDLQTTSNVTLIPPHLHEDVAWFSSRDRRKEWKAMNKPPWGIFDSTDDDLANDGSIEILNLTEYVS